MRRINFFVLLSLFSIFTANALTVDPMVKANFDQGAPFNNMCPKFSAAGCGPVAIAEILSYYKRPLHGNGYVSYLNSKSGETISEDLNEFIFDWDNIPDEFKYGNYTDVEAMGVAKLIYACGVAMNVTYGSSTSTNNKYRMVYNLQHNMYMSPDSRYLNREYYSTPEWIEILNSQLANGYPVFYRGTTHYNESSTGHMFVIDGIDDSGLYHANWGHSGDGNKFTDLNVLNQGQQDGLPGGKNVCYNFKQAMMINCYPVDDLLATPLQWCEMNEPITLNDDHSVNQTEVKLGETFKLATQIVNCSKDTCSISYKWILMDDDREVSSLASGKWNVFPPFYIGKIEKSVSLPISVPDGVYKMVLMSKSSVTPEWQPVRDNPINRIDILINNGIADVIVPDQYKNDPLLYLSEDIILTYGNNNSSLEILCDLINPTCNNYDGNFKIAIETANSSYIYNPEVCVYGDTNVKYRFCIPKAKLDLSDDIVRNVNIWYIYDDQEIALTTMRPDGISDISLNDRSNHIVIYNLEGLVVAMVENRDLGHKYNDILSSLPKGVYIIKESNKTRKLIK